MATADSVKTKLNNLISRANATTGKSDNTLTNAVDTLIGGYNKGGITPSGTKSITANGTYDVTNYASASVNVPSSGITPSGTLDIVANGTFDVTNYASAKVNVPVPTQITELRTVTISQDLGNGTNTTQVILSGDSFIKSHYADDGFIVTMLPLSPPTAATNVMNFIIHGNRNIGASNLARYGGFMYNTSATAVGFMPATAKLNGDGWNISLRARSTGNLEIYVASARIVKAGTYLIAMTLT